MNNQNWQRGDVLREQYEVMDMLGEGGMGTIYKVHHRSRNIDLAGTSVCLSTDGRLVLSEQADGSVRLWTLSRSWWKKAGHS